MKLGVPALTKNLLTQRVRGVDQGYFHELFQKQLAEPVFFFCFFFQDVTLLMDKDPNGKVLLWF